MLAERSIGQSATKMKEECYWVKTTSDLIQNNRRVSMSDSDTYQTAMGDGRSGRTSSPCRLVIKRIHVRSGNYNHQTTIKELFKGKSKAAMGALFPIFPNSTIHQIISLLLGIAGVLYRITPYSPIIYVCISWNKSERCWIPFAVANL